MMQGIGCHTGHHDWVLTPAILGLIWKCKKCGKTRKFEGINDVILENKMREEYGRVH